MKVSAICIGTPDKLPGKSAKTGINKIAVTGAVLVDEAGLVGDSVCNRKYHGGPDQAVYGMGSLDLDWWSAELGYRIEPGLFGDNIVIDGIDSRTVRVGDRFVMPDIVLEVTSTRTPCTTLSSRMGDPHFARRFNQAGRPGFYCRVLATGTLKLGDEVRHEPYGRASVTMAQLLAMNPKRIGAEDRAMLLRLPISERLRSALGALRTD